MQKTCTEKPAASEFALNTDASDQGEMIVAKVPQGYDTNINMRLVPGRNVDIIDIFKMCRSRTGVPRREAEPLILPQDLIDKIKKADKTVIKWLAHDEANARLFMARPAEALLKAGVDLTRAEQKAIDRTHHEVVQVSIVSPGVKVARFTAAAFQRGQIGKFKPDSKPKDKSKDNLGCAKEV